MSREEQQPVKRTRVRGEERRALMLQSAKHVFARSNYAEASTSVLDALEHVIDDYYAAIKTDPETQRILFQAVIESRDPEVASCVSRHNQKIYGFIRQLVERAREEGHVDPAISLDAATWGYISM